MEKTLDKKTVSREEAKEFLQNVVVPNYRTFAGFEEFVENYRGERRVYLLKVRAYITERNARGSRVYCLDEFDVENILNATFPENNERPIKKDS